MRLVIFVICSLLWEPIWATCPPLRIKKGVSVKCAIPGSKSLVDCANEIPNGGEAYYQCQKYFMDSFGDQSRGKLICNDQGRWLKMGEYQDFFCVPECGRSRNSSLQTLSSFIEMEFESGDEIFPWHAAIFRRYGETNLFKYSCGGTLVNPSNKGGLIILTAAHCVTKTPSSGEPGALDSFKIVLGAVSTEFRYNIAGNSQIFSAKKIITEREYDPSSLQSDIGMIELSGPIKISETVQPVCFPTRTIASTQVRPGVRGEIPLIRNDQFAYQEIITVPVSEQGECLRDCAREPTNTEFCGTRNTGTSLSNVDSGSGLVFNEFTERPRRYYLQGILTKVARESEGCVSHDTFTSVSVFLDWVNRVHDEIADGQRIKEITVPFKSVSKLPLIPTRSPVSIKSFEERERDRPERPKAPNSYRERDRPKVTNTYDEREREKPNTPNSFEDGERKRPGKPKIQFEDELEERQKLPKPFFLSTSTESPSIFQNDYSRIGIEMHNFYRRKHEVPPLQINDKLSQEAQDWAEYLLKENKWEFSDGKDYSENIFQYFGVISSTDVVKKAVINWYEANTKYNWDSPEASTFSQLVWKGTTHIGIGIASKGTKSIVVTNYWPKGNIYSIGEGDRAKYFKENVLPSISTTLTLPLDDNISLI